MINEEIYPKIQCFLISLKVCKNGKTRIQELVIKGFARTNYSATQRSWYTFFKDYIYKYPSIYPSHLNRTKQGVHPLP